MHHLKESFDITCQLVGDLRHSLPRVIPAVIALALFASTAWADEDDRVFSGPQPGETLRPFTVRLAYGDDEGKDLNLIDHAGGSPLLLVFVNGANRPAARLTRALINYAEMRRGEGLFSGIVYLAEDRSAAAQYLHR